VTIDPVLPIPEPPQRETVGRFGNAAIYSYKGVLASWPVIAQLYARDLLLLGADAIEHWADDASDQAIGRDRLLIAAMRRFAG
jgi:hypothetical protein